MASRKTIVIYYSYHTCSRSTVSEFCLHRERKEEKKTKHKKQRRENAISSNNNKKHFFSFLLFRFFHFIYIRCLNSCYFYQPRVSIKCATFVCVRRTHNEEEAILSSLIRFVVIVNEIFKFFYFII